MTLTAHEITRMPPDAVDQLFRGGEVGQIPDGRADGLAIFRPGAATEPLLGGIVKNLAWRGHVVDSRKRTLKNRILPTDTPAISADVYRDRSWFDGEDCIVLDYSKRSLLARFVRDEIRRVAPGLYLGLVYLNRTRLMYFTLQFTV